MVHHVEADRPLDDALRALAIRQIILDEAAAQGIDVSDAERATAELLDRRFVCVCFFYLRPRSVKLMAVS